MYIALKMLWVSYSAKMGLYKNIWLQFMIEKHYLRLSILDHTVGGADTVVRRVDFVDRGNFLRYCLNIDARDAQYFH